MTTVADVLQKNGRDVLALAASESVLAGARLMSRHGVGSIVVTDDFDVVGIFTEQDMMRRVVAERRDPASTSLRDVMTQAIVFVRPDTSIDDCAAIMSAKAVRHLPAVGSNGVEGMISVRDVLRHQLGHRDATIDHLMDYIQGSERPKLSELMSQAEERRSALRPREALK